MRTIFGKVKKMLAILLAVFFLVSVTAAATSAAGFSKYSPKDNKAKITIVSMGNGGSGSCNGANAKLVAISAATSKAISDKGDASSAALNGGTTVSGIYIDASGGKVNTGDGGSVSVGFVGDNVGWDGAVGSNNNNRDSLVANA